jgi:tetratricopeptide (TPR) repeat protein
MTFISDEPAADPAPAGVSPLASGLLEQAESLARAGSSIDAVARYRELLAQEPGLVEARLRLARLLQRLGDGDEAVAVLSQGIGRDPDQVALTLERGIALTGLRRYREAEEDLRRVLRREPSNQTAEVELGLLAWHRGLTADAVAHFRRALEQRPEARVYGYLADALNQGGDLAGAHQALEQALALDPRNTKALNLMGRVLDRLGRPEEARDVYQRAREIGDR